MKKESVAIISALILFNTLLFILYLSAIKTLVCRREMSLIGSTFFGFAQNTIHDFQNTVSNSLSSTNATKNKACQVQLSSVYILPNYEIRFFPNDKF